MGDERAVQDWTRVADMAAAIASAQMDRVFSITQRELIRDHMGAAQRAFREGIDHLEMAAAIIVEKTGRASSAADAKRRDPGGRFCAPREAEPHEDQGAERTEPARLESDAGANPIPVRNEAVDGGTAPALSVSTSKGEAEASTSSPRVAKMGDGVDDVAERTRRDVC